MNGTLEPPTTMSHTTQADKRCSIWPLRLLLPALAGAASAQLDAPDAYEPNDTFAQAAALPLSRSFEIGLSGVDEDWFAFQAPRDGTLMWHFELPSDEVPPSVALFEVHGENLDQKEFSAGDETLHVAALAPGEYALKVDRVGGAKPGTFAFRANLIDSANAARDGRIGSLFILGMELTDEQLDTLADIAHLGQGRMIEVSSETTSLVVALASVSEESRGATFDTTDFMVVMLDEAVAAIGRVPDQLFGKRWLGDRAVAIAESLQTTGQQGREPFAAGSLAALLDGAREQSLIPVADRLPFERTYLAAELGKIVTMPMTAPD